MLPERQKKAKHTQVLPDRAWEGTQAFGVYLGGDSALRVILGSIMQRSLRPFCSQVRFQFYPYTSRCFMHLCNPRFSGMCLNDG